MKKRSILPIVLFAGISVNSAFSQNLNLLPNPGFEEKTISMWRALDSCGIDLHQKAFHSGKRSLSFHPQKEADGVGMDVSSIAQPGYTYHFTGWFRNLDSGWGQADVELRYRQAGSVQQFRIGRADCDKEGWTRLSGSFFIPDQAESRGIDLIIKAGWGRNAFLADDLELRPALQITVDRSLSVSEPDLVPFLGPLQDRRAKLQVETGIVDSRRRPVRQSSNALGKRVRASLSPGLYHVKAGVKDLDGRQFDAEKIFFVGSLPDLAKKLGDQSDRIVNDPGLARYRGWIRYLQHLASYYRKQEGAGADRALGALYRLNLWTQAIQDNPAVLDTLSKVQEWAYFSRVDDSGQPFKIAIPSPYDPQKAYPLVVVMHGYGGNHMDYSGGVTSHPDYFQLDVLGRARGGGYTDLSEGDVLDAVEYVCSNWPIDDRRIHLTGASMGGGGTFKMASRFPDRWASGRPVCGYGNDMPILNALHVPIYSTHSKDDPTVPVLTSRAPLQKLAKAGGQVVIDETIGLQHAAWNYAEGNDRAQTWALDQVRPDFLKVRHIDFTAVDRSSCQAYWLAVVEWGSMPGPARFRATAGPENHLYLNLENIRTLRIRIQESPFDPAKRMKISVNQNVFLLLDAPLPDSVFITQNDGKWLARTELTDRPPYALHTPGGVHNLYSREPLLIVWGTDGDSTARRAMADAAVAASKSVHPIWVGDEGDIRDNVPNHQVLYGHLKTKPDSAVTREDMEKCHLVLIGGADENRLVRRMQDQLPVQFGKEIICSDGCRIPGDQALMGLYHHNPLVPGRLIYWVAASDPSSYRPYSFLFQLQDDNACGTDLLVVQDNPPRIVKVRHFDSRWSWSGAFEKSAKLTDQECTYGGVFGRMAEVIRIATGSDFAVQQFQAPPEMQLGLPGTTSWSDIASLDLTSPISVMMIKGAILLNHQKGFADNGSRFRFFPEIGSGVNPEKEYRVALSAWYGIIQQWINLQNHVPDSLEILDMTVFEAMRRMLFQEVR